MMDHLMAEKLTKLIKNIKKNNFVKLVQIPTTPKFLHKFCNSNKKIMSF